MYSQKYSRGKNKTVTQHPKKEKPRPQWTTDFVDRSNYRLSEAEMIQKKAALQSKHRQQAKQLLQQRRRKLQMGIIDQQTRKIYQTALTSKKIDINPPIRKNLTEMIKYERQQKEKMNQTQEDQQNYDSENQQQNDPLQQSEREIKEAQAFIKKFEKAKKQQKIQRAVQILTNDKRSVKNNQRGSGRLQQNQPKVNNFLQYMMMDDINNSKYNKKNLTAKSSESKNFSQDEAISSIEDTIKFMEEKLFAAKKTVEQHSKSFIHQTNEQQESFIKHTQQRKGNFYKKKNASENLIDNQKNNFILDNPNEQDQMDFGQRMAEISQLRIKLKQQNDSSQDDQCMETIRRMRQLMQNKQIQFQTNTYKNDSSIRLKQNIRDNVSPTVGSLDCNSTIQKNSHHYTDSQAQVSFSLTANQDHSYQYESFPLGSKKNNNFSKQISSKQDWQITGNNKIKNKSTKQQQYQNQYQKIKQNLFNCLGVNDYQNEQEEQSRDSLMIQDKINMWKKELQPQVDPQQQEQSIQLPQKYNNVARPPNFQKPSRIFIKQSQQEDEDQAVQPYRYTYLNQKSQPINSPFSNTLIKKPPLSRKTPQQSNTQFQTMKNIISNASNEIKKIEIQPLKIQPLNQSENVLGFDFRGSINLKKNVGAK